MIERRHIKDRAEWLAWRKADVTASVVAALPEINRHEYMTPLRLFVEKSNPTLMFALPDNKVLRRGRWLESAVAEAVREERPNWTIYKPNLYFRDPDLRLGATPDYLIETPDGGRGVLQCKTVAPSAFARDWDDGNAVPFWIVLQCLTECMLVDAAFGAVAALIVDPFAMDVSIIDVPRFPAAEDKIVSAVRSFWNDVANGREPEPNFARDDAAIRALWPRELAGKTVDLSSNNELPHLLALRARLVDAIKQNSERKDAIDAELRYMIGNAERVVGVNGWSITYKSQHRPAYTVPAKDIRTLRITDKRPLDELERQEEDMQA